MLRGLEINRVNQVWATYIPMARRFLYLVAIMDWHIRYVLAWRLSNTLEAKPALSTRVMRTWAAGKPARAVPSDSASFPSILG